MGENYLGSVKILGATLCAAVLIVGAYVLARGVGSPPAVQASTEAELLASLASRDADSDGLRDWEEALYGTNPQVADTRKLGMTDGEAVSKGLIVPVAPSSIGIASSTPSSFDPSIPVPAKGTITLAVAESFFTSYMTAVQKSPNGTLSQSEIRKISDEILEKLSESLVQTPDFRSIQSLKIDGSGVDELKTFAARADEVFRINKANATTSEIVYLKNVIENDDTTAYTHLASISRTYQNTAAGLAALSVPKDLASDVLLLINAMARLSNITDDFTRADSDPFATILALKQYPDAVKDLGTAFIHINGAYKTAGVTFAPSEPGSRFANLIEEVVAEQNAKSTKKP